MLIILARSCTPSSFMCVCFFLQLPRNATCNANDEFGQGPESSVLSMTNIKIVFFIPVRKGAPSSGNSEGVSNGLGCCVVVLYIFSFWVVPRVLKTRILRTVNATGQFFSRNLRTPCAGVQFCVKTRESSMQEFNFLGQI